MGLDPYANCNYSILEENCTLETCCLAQSSFLYIPSYGGNLFFTIFFAVFIIPQLALGIKYKTWGYMVGLTSGLILEVVGYCARVWLHNNPFSNNAFLMYLICLTIAPVFITAGIYLCLGRIIVIYGSHLSFFKPRTLALVFMTSDYISLVLQAAGGAIAEVSTDDAGSNTGKYIMIAGLLLQVISLVFFITVWASFIFQVRTRIPDQDPVKASIRQRPLFYAFQAGLLLATVIIIVRSIYRVVELWGGFSGSLWNDQVDFMVLDGAMISLAVILLTALHPGLAFGGLWNTANWTFRNKKVAGDSEEVYELKAASE